MIYAGVTCGEKWDGQDSVEMEILGVCPGWALLWALNQESFGVV